MNAPSHQLALTDQAPQGAVHKTYLWFTEIAGAPAEVERCEDGECPECILVVASPLPDAWLAA